MDIEEVRKKAWSEVTESDLIFLYLDQDLIKQEIADIFQVTKSQVKSKLSKYGINKQRKWMRDSLNYGIKQAGKETLAELVFGFHDIANATANDKLISGPVKVINGKHKGRIGIYADHQDNFGFVYWGNMINNLDLYDQIELSCLTNHITTYDLVKRSDILYGKLFAELNASSTAEEHSSYGKWAGLYSEYILVLQLLNKVYLDTQYMQGDGNKKVFISHSSADKEISLSIASDLKLSNYNVWLDKWDLKLGHSIPQSITDGLDSADALLIILSKDYLESAYCKDEWQGYYMKYNTMNRPIVVIIIDESDPPTLLAARKYYRLNSIEAYDEMISELRNALAEL
mgnify:CR=1 FL=1